MNFCKWFFGLIAQFTLTITCWGADSAHLIVMAPTETLYSANTRYYSGGVLNTSTNKMGSVTVSASATFKAYNLAIASGTWSDAEASPPTAGKISFSLGYIDPSNPAARSGIAFACAQMAELAKAKSKRFIYGNIPFCATTNTAFPTSYQWLQNTFETETADDGIYYATTQYQTASASEYSVVGTATTYTSVPTDFCGIEYGTNKWITESYYGIGDMSTDANGKPSAAATINCGAGPGVDAKYVFTQGIPILVEGNQTGSTPNDFYYNSGGYYLKMNQISPSIWGCATKYFQQLYSGSITSLLPQCLFN